MAGLISRERKPTPWLSFAMFLMIALEIAAVAGAVICGYLSIPYPIEEWRPLAVLFVLISIGASMPTYIIWYIREKASKAG